MTDTRRYGADTRIDIDPNLFTSVEGDTSFASSVPPRGTSSLPGTYLASRIQNPQETAGILLSGALPSSWTKYLDLTDVASQPYFLKHEKFALNHDGTAQFVPVAVLPPSPTEGMFVYTSPTHQFQFWNGTGWVTIGTGTVGVASVQGTTNQITATPITGDVIVALASSGTLPGTWTAETGLIVPTAGGITFSAGGGGTGIQMNNRDIVNVNNITFSDPGPQEGLSWLGGNLWKIYESPDDLTTNSSGNLQFVQSTTRRMTLTTAGRMDLVTGPLVLGGTPPVAIGTQEYVATDGTRQALAGVDATRGLFGMRSNHEFSLLTNNTRRWTVDTNGHFLAVTDNSFDIGASAATRPRTAYLGTGLVVAIDPGNTETVRIGGTLRIGNTNAGPATGSGLVLANTAASGANINQTAGGRVDNTFTDTSQAVDEKRWDISIGGVGGPKTFVFITRTDAGAAGTQWLRAIRGTGTAVTNVEVATDSGALRTTNSTTLGDSGNRWGKLWTTSADISTTALITGDLTLGARLIFSTAAGKILMGATSLTVRDSGDTANILGISSTGGVTITGSTAELVLNPRSGGGAAWELYAPTTSDFRIFYNGSDRYNWTTAEYFPATGTPTLGKSTNRWGKLWGNDADFSSGVVVAGTLSVTGGKLLVDGTDSTLASGEMGLVENSGELWIGARSVVRLLMDDDNTGTGSVVISKGTQASPTHLFTFDLSGNLNWNTTNILLQRAGSTRLSATATLLTSAGDFAIGTLGTFDSTDTPLEANVLLYHAGSTNKWQAESLQLVYNAGDSAIALLVDNTSVAYVYLDPGTGADSPVGAPPVPVIKLFPHHKAVTVGVYASTGPDIEYHDGASFPADFRHFIYEYSLDNFATAAKSLATATSDKAVHGRLTAGTTYYYRVRAVDKAGNASANSAVVSFTATSDSQSAAFGIILASEISVDRLAALSANIGIITAGQLRNSGNTSGVNLGGAGGIPGTWTSGINFEAAAGSGSMTRYLNFTAAGSASFLKHERLELNVDGVVKMYINSARPLFNLTSTDFYVQSDEASPTSGIIVTGTRPGTWARFLDLRPSGLPADSVRMRLDGGIQLDGGYITNASNLLANFNGFVSLGRGAVGYNIPFVGTFEAFVSGGIRTGNGDTIGYGVDYAVGNGVTIPNYYGVLVRDIQANPFGGTGVVTTSYGLKVENIAYAGTNYAIYTGTGLVRIGDDIVMGAAASRLRGGATSFAIRDNANANDNMLISNAGAVTFRSTVGGITTLTATTLAGTLSTAAQPNVTSLGTLTGLTIGGNLTFTGASRKLIPGTTDFAWRNNADSANNLIITDAGDATFRTKITMPGPLVLTTAASKIVPGATSLSLRNNADGADNILIADAGAITLRSSVSGLTTLSQTSYHEHTEEAAPGTPAGNKTRDYAKDVGGVSTRYWKDDAGVEHPHNLTLIDTQTFTATGAGTWTKPSGAVLVKVVIVGAGGGGGGGQGGSAGTNRTGGTGGGGGGRMEVWFSAADLGSTEALSVGTGGGSGAGGVAGLGTDGTSGGDSWFGNATQANAKAWAYGGGGGRGGQGGGLTGGGGGGAMSAGAQGTTASFVRGGRPSGNIALDLDGQGFGGAGSDGGSVDGSPAEWGGGSGAGQSGANAGKAGGVSQYGGGGGGSGGGLNVTNVETAGGAGGNNTVGASGGGGTAGAVNGGAGGNGAAGDNFRSGQGGGGGGAQDSGTGGVGGNGGAPGGGAGGGGGGTTTGGAGGTGARGEVRVYSFA